MKLLKILTTLCILFFSSNLIAQQISDGIVLAHFNAEWNKSNAVTWLDSLEDCNLAKIDIVKYPKFQAKHKIVVVPTLILFKDGEEVKRWQANVAFKIEEEIDIIQEAVDEQNLSDF
jgi:thioredoxin-like negative regulator of GroEL